MMPIPTSVRLTGFALALLVSLQLAGCASIHMSPPKATLETTVSLRSTTLAPAALGKFSPDAALSADSDRSMSLRGANSVSSPIDGSFSQYLRESLRVELEAAGLFEPASRTVIGGTLIRSEVDAAIVTGTAKLAARIVVTRDGAVKYDKELVVDDFWASSFMGATAIRLAAAHYEGLYRKLAAKVLDDPQFRAALAPQ
jgi:hypothetical protein